MQLGAQSSQYVICGRMDCEHNLFSQEAKAKALAKFKRKYPNADMSNFTTEVTFDDKNRAMGVS